MRFRRSFRAAFVLIAVAAAAGCRPPNPLDETDYVGRLSATRAAKDASFMRSGSPVPESRRAELLPLSYYPIEAAYAVPARLRPSPDNPVMMMVTSTGTQEEMRRVGQLEFTLRGEPLKLTAFAPVTSPNVDRLFVPFSDLTSGDETYQTGRYLDLDRTGTGLYLIDFNLAYNPYCYFSPTYICPVPTQENRLPVRIEAGERVKPGTSQT